MPVATTPSWLDPSNWENEEGNAPQAWELGAYGEEPDEPFIVDGGSDSPQP